MRIANLTSKLTANHHAAPSPGKLLVFYLIIAFIPMALAAERSELRASLTFFAPFDQSADAQFAKGDPKIYWAPSMKAAAQAKPGLSGDAGAVGDPGGHVRLAANSGRFGGSLRFDKKANPMVFFRGKDNIAYATKDWSGTVSFWLRASFAELETGYCDPIQITPRMWNDAAFFVEFEKRGDSVPFRLGVYSDFKIWNPANRKWEDIPFAEKPLLEVNRPPFQGDRWTHVAFTFSHFNTGAKTGVARLYLNGESQGEISAREQTFQWDSNESRIMLGLSYVGFFDELAIFNRALQPEEVRNIHQLPKGIGALLE